MRIGIDAGPLLGEGGISEYVRPLVHSLLEVDPVPRYDLVLRRGWLAHDRARDLDLLAPVTRLGLPDRLLALWWDYLRRPLPVPRGLWESLDFFLATCLLAPVLPRGQVVSFVYDLTPLRLPHLFPEHRRFRRQMERLLDRSAAVVAISRSTRRDLQELMGKDPALVRVIYPGLGESFRPAPRSRVEETSRRLGIRGPYILYVGALGPHKNLPLLLRAYQRARLAGGLEARLVLVGSTRWARETLAVREGLRVREDVLLAGSVPSETLPALYSGAEVFVFPSLYEGFGLPVLEAMACGTPVIVSNRGALPEVAGLAGLYVDPEDEAHLAETLCRIARSAEMRARMAAAGQEQAGRFSWTRSARELASLFRELAGAEAPGSKQGRGRASGESPSETSLPPASGGTPLTLPGGGAMGA